MDQGHIVKDGYHPLSVEAQVPDGHHLEGAYEVPPHLFREYARIVPDDCRLVYDEHYLQHQ